MLRTDGSDGHAAFPYPENTNSSPHPGMSLRQWYAGQALAGICATMHDDPLEVLPGKTPEEALKDFWEAVAKTTFLIADAMLAESAK